MNRLKTFGGILAFFLLAVTAVPSHGGDSAQPVLKQAVDDVLEYLSRPCREPDCSKEDLKKKVYDRIEPVFDFHMLSMGALGVLRRQFSREQEIQFAAYFSKLVVNTYFEKIDSDGMEQVKIQYLGTRDINSRSPSVQRMDVDTLVTKDNINIPIVYRMINQNGSGWKIYDIQIEGVSMVANYREQYRAKMGATPVELIEEIKGKVSQ